MVHRWRLAVFAWAGLLAACSQSAETGSNSPSGAGNAAVASGGSEGSSSDATVGGTATATTGNDSPTAGGTFATETPDPSGGASGRGGAVGSNGGVSAGGATTASASSAIGNAPAKGGSTSSGGSKSVGGATSKGGSGNGGVATSATTSKGGNANGGVSSSGASSKGGAATSGAASKGGAGTGGTSIAAAGAPSAGSKRGIAANTAPGAAFYPAVRWWYNWAIRSSGANVGIEFVPMVWDEKTVSSAIPSGSKYVLGFNEPNFFVQANLSPTESASYWPPLQINAASAGVEIVGPGMNFCGPAAQCHGTDPYQYLKDFFAACTDCKVDYVAVHWYNCDLPSLRDYLEPGGNLAGFEQFGKPIWITEFSCDTSATVAQQEAFMRAAIPYLESNPKVARYSWFSADPIPNAKLVNSDGSPTALGQVYISLPHN